ncbi:MAG: hypothetical protein MHM6MM_002676 [Cercozoa sp. M6MM]
MSDICAAWIPQGDLSLVREWQLGTKNTTGGVALLDVDGDGIDELILSEVALFGGLSGTDLVVYKIEVEEDRVEVTEWARQERVGATGTRGLWLTDTSNRRSVSRWPMEGPIGIIFYLKQGTGEVKGTQRFPLSASAGESTVPVQVISRGENSLGTRRIDTYETPRGSVSVFGSFAIRPCDPNCDESLRYPGRVALVFYDNNASGSGKRIIDRHNERTLVLGFLRDTEEAGEYPGGGLYYDDTIARTQWAGIQGGAYLGDLDGDGAPEILTGDYREGSLLLIGTRLDQQGRVIGDAAKTVKFSLEEITQVFGAPLDNFGWSFGSACVEQQ